MAATGLSDDKISVFISYSRDDLAFADQLDAALRLHKFGVVLDRKGISPGEPWQPRLGAMIRDADTVAFILSPASAASPVCKWEVAEAVRLGKRIVPVLCRPLGDATAPEQLAERNYIYFYDEPDYPGSGFGTGLVRLVETLETDLDWLREGTRLLQRSSEWDEGRRSDGRLLFGDSIAAAKGWLARQPSNAPPPTTLLLDYIRASEEHDTRRQSEERQRLAEREELVRKAEAEQAEREAAQRREAEQARRAVRIRTVGLAASLVLAAVAGVAGLLARQGQQALTARTTDLEAANQRLGAEMRLRVAPFGKDAYEIPERWYKLATTNAISVAFIEFTQDEKWYPAGSGFVIRGKDLYPPWGEQVVFVTAGHVYHEQRGAKRARIQFPALNHKPRVALGPPLWVAALPSSGDTDAPNMETADAAVFSLSDKLPAGVQPVIEISDVDVMQWPEAKFIRSDQLTVEGSVLDRVFPLITLGATTMAPRGTPNPPLRLTLSLANALGRDQSIPSAKGKFVATDSTTIGSSGTPVFDANDGTLLGIIQYGTEDPKQIRGGLAFSGGTTMRTIKEAIVEDAAVAADSSRKMFLAGNIELGEMYVVLARTRDPSAAATLVSARAEGYVKSGANRLRDGGRFDTEAIADFAIALKYDQGLAGRIDAAWSEAYVSRGENAMAGGRIADGEALFQQALRKTPQDAKKINAAWSQAYVRGGESAIRNGKADDADALFQKAHRMAPDNAGSIDADWLQAYVWSGGEAMRFGRVEEADFLFQRAAQKWPDSAKATSAAWAEAYLGRWRERIYSPDSGDDAEAAFRRAVDLDSSLAPRIKELKASGHLQAGQLQLQMRRDSEAEAHFAEALRHDPTLATDVSSTWATELVSRARQLLDEGKLPEAELVIDRALKQHPDQARNSRASWAQYLADKAQRLLSDGNDAAAETASQLAITHDPNLADRIGADRARAHVQRGKDKLRDDEAAAKAQFALARLLTSEKPSNATVRAEIAEAWLQHGKPEEGLADAEAFYTLYVQADARSAHQLRGRVYLALNRVDEALKDLDQAVSLGDRSPVTYLARGRGHELTGNRAAAIEDYQAAIETNWSHYGPARDQARTRLKELGVEPRRPPPRPSR